MSKTWERNPPPSRIEGVQPSPDVPAYQWELSIPGQDAPVELWGAALTNHNKELDAIFSVSWFSSGLAYNIALGARRPFSFWAAYAGLPAYPVFSFDRQTGIRERLTISIYLEEVLGLSLLDAQMEEAAFEDELIRALQTFPQAYWKDQPSD